MADAKWKWISKDPMMDGSGVIDFDGHTVKIIVQDLVTTKSRVAFVNGHELVRAYKFTTLLKRLERALK